MFNFKLHPQNKIKGVNQGGNLSPRGASSFFVLHMLRSEFTTSCHSMLKAKNNVKLKSLVSETVSPMHSPWLWFVVSAFAIGWTWKLIINNFAS